MDGLPARETFIQNKHEEIHEDSAARHGYQNTPAAMKDGWVRATADKHHASLEFHSGSDIARKNAATFVQKTAKGKQITVDQWKDKAGNYGGIGRDNSKEFASDQHSDAIKHILGPKA